MLMLIGWRVFRYSRRAFHRDDEQSHCGADIGRYSQSIFTNEPTGLLTIYTTASKTIEVFVSKDDVEARLLLWKECAITSMVLEKVGIDKGNFRSYGREVEVVSSGHSFVLSFYEVDEASQFISICNEGTFKAFCTYGSLVEGSIEHSSSVNPTRLETAFISGMRLLNGSLGGSATEYRMVASTLQFVSAMDERNKGSC